MLLVIIPKFSQVYAQLGTGLPPATRKMISFSEWFTANVGFFFYWIFFYFNNLVDLQNSKGGYALDSIN